MNFKGQREGVCRRGTCTLKIAVIIATPHARVSFQSKSSVSTRLGLILYY